MNNPMYNDNWKLLPQEVQEAVAVLCDFVEDRASWADSDPDYDMQDWKMRRVMFMSEHLDAFVDWNAELVQVTEG